MLGNKLDYSNWLKEKLKNGSAKEFKKGTSKIKPLQTFEQKLASINTEDELYGFANRRRVLGINLPEWNEEQVKAIKWRLMEIRKTVKVGLYMMMGLGSITRAH